MSHPPITSGMSMRSPAICASRALSSARSGEPGRYVLFCSLTGSGTLLMSLHSEYARSAAKSRGLAPMGLGCMRLSTEPERDDERALTVLHAAFDGGVTFLDTADAYCLDDSEVGHNERLIARARDTWTGDRSRIVV